jgi:hypothetical protein
MYIYMFITEENKVRNGSFVLLQFTLLKTKILYMQILICGIVVQMS